MTTQAQATPTNTPARSKREVKPLNGVDTPALFATINAVAEQPDLAQFRFRATNRWLSGTHSRTEIGIFSSPAGDHSHLKAFTYDSDHHPVLCGEGHAPSPIEFLLHALAGCIMAGIGNIAAARGVKLSSVAAEIDGDINLLGLLGLSKQVRNGYQGIRIRVHIQGDAPPDKLKQIVEQSRCRSAVFDVLTNGVPIDFGIAAD